MRLLSAHDFLRDLRGNVALMFGLIIFVVLCGAGIAIDLQRASLARAEINEAADASLLAAARYKSMNPNASAAELTAVARKIFDNGLNGRMKISVDAFAIRFDSASELFALDVDATLDTLLMGVVGQKTVDIGTRAEARLGKPPLLEVALALDVTGSMKQHGKISALKRAAGDLIDTLFDMEGADVKMGIVPFAQYVNVDASNAGSGWVDAPKGAWSGCVGSRAYPLNVQDTGYVASRVPGLSGVPCPTALLPLTADQTALRKKINSLSAQGWTYIPSGLAWGWRLLTPGEPFAQGISFAELAEKRGTKALILMTDGENTRAPDYPTHNSANENLADDLTRELCVNVKAQEIVVYTIAFEVSDPGIKDILEDCATAPSHYFDAANAGDLVAAFQTIGASLRNISLSK